MTQFTIIPVNYPKSQLKPLAQLHMKIDTFGFFFCANKLKLWQVKPYLDKSGETIHWYDQLTMVRLNENSLLWFRWRVKKSKIAYTSIIWNIVDSSRLNKNTKKFTRTPENVCFQNFKSHDRLTVSHIYGLCVMLSPITKKEFVSRRFCEK